MDQQMAIMMQKNADLQLQASWGNMEKETLKKYLLIFGYGRWRKIRESGSSCKILVERPEGEM